jgi:hypothetical protein
MPYGTALPTLSPGKSWVLTSTGQPAGRHCRPAFLNSPRSSFFLVSTLITGCPASRWARACSLRYRNCVTVRMLFTLQGLAVALQAEAVCPQQISDGVGGHRMTLGAQFASEGPGRFCGPPQRRHRITALVRLDQGQQRRTQPEIPLSRCLTTPTGADGPDPAAAHQHPAHQHPATRPLPEPPQPAPPPGSRHIPDSTLQHPSTADAAAHPDTARSPGTSPQASPGSPPRCSQHSNEPDCRKLRVISRRALSTKGRTYVNGWGATGLVDRPLGRGGSSACRRVGSAAGSAIGRRHVRCRIRRAGASRGRRHAGQVGPRVPSVPPTPPGGRGR